MAFGAQNIQHGAGDGELIHQSKRSERGERASHVKRRGQDTGLHCAAPALRIDEHQTIEISYFVAGTYAAIEIFEVGAATECDMLAIVHMLAARQNVRSRAAAKKWALLEETDAPAGLSQRDAGCQTR